MIAKRSMRNCRWMKVFLGLAMSPLFFVAGEPAPFRRDDELSGRSYCHKDREFIHRQTFRFRTQLQQRWLQDPSGFRTTFGSSSSKNFYVITEAGNIWELAERLDVEMRFFHGEDLDGRYDRLLTGIGATPSEKWRMVVLGDIVAEKQNIDVYLETIWTPKPKHRLRLAAIAVDAMHLDRSFDVHYRRHPYTFFGQYTGRPGDRMELDLWVNVNPDLKLELYDDNMMFRYRQMDAGITATVPLAENWSTIFDGVFTQSERRWDSIEQGGIRGSLRRQFHHIGVELWREPPDAISSWLGVRHISLDERLLGQAPGLAEERFETMVHGGVQLPIPRWRALFWPGLYFSFVEKNDVFVPNDPERSESTSGRGILKAAFPLEFSFAQGKSLTLNVTLVSDSRKTGFGGGNIQGVFPF